jgi:hypothetical protein
MDGRKKSAKQKHRLGIENDKKAIKIMCVKCTQLLAVTNFYISNVDIHDQGRVPYCKKCIKKMISNEQGNVSLVKVQSALQLMDKPFINDYWTKAMASPGDVFGRYIRVLSLIHLRHLRWKDSEFDSTKPVDLDYIDIEKDIIRVDLMNIVVTDEIVIKWGFGYPDEEYQAFERKYLLLKENYSEKTAMHTEALLNYIRYRVKEEMCTAKGNVKDAKEWGGLAEKAAIAAKINPSQLSKADLQDGLNTFGELVRAVEQAQDLIPILPAFKESPQDKPDFVLWCFINYIRDLKGLPLCEYKEIWKFYEERKNQYDEQEDSEYNEASEENEGDVVG